MTAPEGFRRPDPSRPVSAPPSGPCQIWTRSGHVDFAVRPRRRYCCGMTVTLLHSPDPKTRLADGLSDFVRPARSGIVPHAAGLFSYCSLSRERLTATRLPHPVIGVVLSGAKEVWRGDMGERFLRGTLFVLPSGIDLDIVNEPGGRSHLYQSLIIEVREDLLPDWAVAEAACDPAPMLSDSFAVPLTPALVDMMLHAARDIATGPAAGPVRTARLCELLSLLRPMAAALPLFNASVAGRVAQLVRSRLTDKWTATTVARRMAMSESTLRRRLAAEGRSFSLILKRERMAMARRLIDAGMGSGAAANAVGYASRAHFAEAFRQAYGDTPRPSASGQPAEPANAAGRRKSSAGSA